MTARTLHEANEGGALSSLAKALAPYLREQLCPESPPREYYSQNDSPLGKRRHLALAKKGAFPSRKVGRAVLVQRGDLHEFIDSHASVHSEPQSEVDNEGRNEDADVLADWGLCSKGSR